MLVVIYRRSLPVTGVRRPNSVAGDTGLRVKRVSDCDNDPGRTSRSVHGRQMTPLRFSVILASFLYCVMVSGYCLSSPLN